MGTLRSVRLLVCAAALAGCGHDSTAPTTAYGHMQLALPAAAAFPGGSSVNRLHVTFKRMSGEVALDTTVTVTPSPTNGQLLSFQVALASTAERVSGERMMLTVDFLGSTGATVFHFGPVAVSICGPDDITPGCPPYQFPDSA